MDSVAAKTLLAESGALERLLSKTERRRYQQTSHKRKQAEFLLSRHLLRQALSEQFGGTVQDWSIDEQFAKPPLVHGLPAGWCFSVSHSHELIGVTLAACRHGLDIEHLQAQRRFLALAEAAFASEELMYIKQNPACQAAVFYRIWCAKEALFKALGDDQAGVTLAELSYFALHDVAAPWYLYETECEGYQVSIVAERSVQRLDVTYVECYL